MSVTALHIWIWGLTPIIPCSFAQALSSWMGSIGENQSSHLSADSPRVFQVWTLAAPLKDYQVLVLKPFQCCFGCIFGDIVLLECKSSLPSKVFCTLKQVLLKDLPVFGSTRCSICPYKSWNVIYMLLLGRNTLR